jgi:hypothetical protein
MGCMGDPVPQFRIFPALSLIFYSCRLGQLNSETKRNRTNLVSYLWRLEWEPRKEVRISTRIFSPGSISDTYRHPDNNDGITIIDVTDPKNPSYCFFASAYDAGAPLLSATGYVRGYYPEPTHEDYSLADEGGLGSQEESVLSTVHPFKSVPLITMQTLAEAWPAEYKATAPAEELARNDEQPQGLPTLSDLALGPALEQVLLTGDIDEFELIIAIPDKTAKMKELLRSRQHSIPDSGIPLLEKLFESEIYGQREKLVDLSQLPLSGQQIFDIIIRQPDLDTLNLSHNERVSIDVVERLLVALPRLRRLLVLDTSIAEEDAIALLERRPELFRNVEAFIHPAFLKAPSKARFKGAYMHISDSNYNFGTYAVSIPFFTTDQIIQGLTDYFNPLVIGEVRKYSLETDYMHPVMAAYASEVRSPGHSWGERIVPFVPSALSPAQSLARKGRQWVFIFHTSSRMNRQIEYAFSRASGEVWDEFLKMRKQINQEAKNSTPPMSNQEKKKRVSEISKALGPRIFEVFDIRQFFKELELEGREPPLPEALDRLFDIFSKLGDSGGPELMDVDALVRLLTSPRPF